LIENADINIILCLPFTREFAMISPESFVKDLLIDKIGIKELVVGYDYSFGYKRSGNIDLLKKMGSELGFLVHVIDQVFLDGTPVSSTIIRNLVREGELSEAKKLLGRDHQVRGAVIKGKNRGARLLGFPTANLQIVDELTPKPGVYVVRVLINDRQYDGLTNIGYNPTFGNDAISVETHILDFSGDLVGESIRVDFIQRLRDEKTFSSVTELADQIKKDVLAAREIFKKMNER
jgi:riboflavin kinase / FMN adenylyltransferase